MADDKIQREIEEILSRLDRFVPEESVASRMRRRSSDLASAFHRAVIASLGRISLSQVMLTALALIILSLFFMRVHPVFARWVIIAGLILFFTSFALSFLGRGPKGSGKTVKYWRDRPLELDGDPRSEPGWGERLRVWLRSRRRSQR